MASDADPSTPIAVVSGRLVLGGVGGTSAGAPLWAGLVALADQYAGWGSPNAAVLIPLLAR